jgi:ubiquinone/menaquinone biosynthesis C-methylase UbiE
VSSVIFRFVSIPAPEELSFMERILDLGCGTGDSWRCIPNKVENCRIIGIDLQQDRVRTANLKYGNRGWSYLCARGEAIPLADASIDGVICEVALPYMHIPRALAELRRVLVPGGWFKATLHPPRFTWNELLRAFPHHKQTLFRIFVLLNGMVLHLSGRVISIGKIAESCQTNAGIRLALRRAGFEEVSLRHESGRFYLHARCADAVVVEEPEVLSPVA